VFGLVHGAGFANYLRDLFSSHIALPLFGFNVGIELGQITVLCIAAVALVAIDRLLRFPLRLRIVTISTAVLIVATHWAVQRNPW
jgi:hypothetical protein